MLFLSAREFYDYATTQDRLLARDRRETAVIPSSNQERVGVLILRFSKLNSPAHQSNAFTGNHCVDECRYYLLVLRTTI
jgi:hypothetical protein